MWNTNLWAGFAAIFLAIVACSGPAKLNGMENMTPEQIKSLMKKESSEFQKQLAAGFKNGGFLQNESFFGKDYSVVTVNFYEGQHPLVKGDRVLHDHEYKSRKDLIAMDNDPFVNQKDLLFILEHGQIIAVYGDLNNRLGYVAEIRLSDELSDLYPLVPLVTLSKPRGFDRWIILFIQFGIIDI